MPRSKKLGPISSKIKELLVSHPEIKPYSQAMVNLVRQQLPQWKASHAHIVNRIYCVKRHVSGLYTHVSKCHEPTHKLSTTQAQVFTLLQRNMPTPAMLQKLAAEIVQIVRADTIQDIARAINNGS